MMTAIKEKHLKDLNGNLSNTLQGEDARNGYAPLNPDTGNPFTEAENPSDTTVQGTSKDYDLARDEAYGENAGFNQTNSISNSDITPGPGDEDDDDDLDDDDDFLDDDDDEGNLIPIEGDEEDDDTLLSADEDEDVIPGTDLDDDELIDDDDSDVSRASLGDLGSNNTKRDTGRTTGRMIDHEPGTSEI